jgi:cell wall-associated protease
MFKNFLLVIIVVLFIRCDSKKSYSKINLPQKINLFQKQSPLSEEEEKNWYLKDIITDSLPGISLTQIYDSLLINKKGKEVIIAVLDSEIDIEHKDIKKHIWKNEDEIPNNGIDDDKNGYIDDIYGWNFLGNNKGENASFTSYAYTRILKKYDSLFKDKKKQDIKSKDSLLFFTYLRAKEKYKSRVEYAKEDIEYADMLLESMANVKKILSQYFPYKKYIVKDLDSLKKIFPNNEELQDAVLIRSNFINYGFSQEYMNLYKLKAEERINKLLNVEFNERIIIGDDPEDITDTSYGNNNINGNISLFTHGTEVSSTITSLNDDNIKIMTLAISPFGDEHDKDIALAIRYAIDNGAKVINMSFCKEFSLHRKWVNDAFKYAKKNNVIIIAAAGNEAQNLNSVSIKFPNDILNNGEEVSDNFISVGSISNSLNKKILSYFSNYSNNYVDIFAPGNDIYTALPNNKHNFNGGTSLASAITSGVAALLYAYYPNLTASQVKHILMDSGLEYDIEVSTPTKDDKNKMTPFNQLSKSGKVLNAYNAFIMADSISRSN